MSANMAAINIKVLCIGNMMMASKFQIQKKQTIWKNIQYAWKGALCTFTDSCSGSRYQTLMGLLFENIF